MVHGDNDGIIVPPRVAPIQVVIVPIYTKTNTVQVNQKCTEIAKLLTDAGIRVEADLRENYKSGWKYNHWELKGVPVRLEIGQNDLDNNVVVAVRRDTKEKTTVPVPKIIDSLKHMLVNIQQSLYDKAKRDKDEHTKSALTWKEFLEHLNNKNIVKVPFCCTDECESEVKVKSGQESKAIISDSKFELTGSAKSLCIPFEQDPLPDGTKCFSCERDAVSWTLFGRSY